MRKIQLFLTTFFILILSAELYAGEAPRFPGYALDANRTMMFYSLEDIYNLATRRTVASKKTGVFVLPDPDQNPAVGTGHTINDIYEAVRTHAAVPQPTGTADSPAEGYGVPWPYPRFTINIVGNNDTGGAEEDDTVIDHLTNLEWRRTYGYVRLGDAFSDPIQQDAELAKIKTLVDAIAAYNSTENGPGRGKYHNWRLPTPKELFLLCDPSYDGPAMSERRGTGQAQNENPFIYRDPPAGAISNIGKELWLTAMISQRPKPIGEEEHVSLYAFSFDHGLITTVDTMWIDYAQAFCVRNITDINATN